MKYLYMVGLGRGDLAALAILEQQELMEVGTVICAAAPPHLLAFLKKQGRRVVNLAASLEDNGPYPLPHKGKRWLSWCAACWQRSRLQP
jgi:hypothetical protein